MHIKGKNSWIKHLDFMVIDILSLIISFVIAYFVKFHSFDFLFDSTWKSLLLITSLINLIILFFLGPYSGIFRRRYYEDLMKFALIVFYNFCLSCLVFYLFKMGIMFSRAMLIMMYVLYYVISILCKYVRKQLLLSGKIKSFNNRIKRLLVITTNEDVEETLDYIGASDFKEYDIVGICYAENEAVYKEVDEISILSGIDEIPKFAFKNRVNDVFVAVKPSWIRKECYEQLVENGVTIHLNIESMLGFQTDDQFVTHVGVYKSLCVGTFSFNAQQMVYIAIKRLFDIILGVFGCILLVPIMAIVKISYLTHHDKDPILYVSDRVGLNGKIFKIYKFRTMVPDAPLILREMLKEEKFRLEWEKNQKFENDPRITKLGKLLRRTSLDEIPQFINMLKGDMSLVGPRPLVEGELEEHNGLMMYNQVKPGITGWWGCNGRSNISYRERLELEYYYIKNCSMSIDLLCILRTVFAVLKKEGAS